MKKFRVQFWLENGNHYSWFIKAKNHEDAGRIAYDMFLSKLEPCSEIGEIAFHQVSKER